MESVHLLLLHSFLGGDGSCVFPFGASFITTISSAKSRFFAQGLLMKGARGEGVRIGLDLQLVVLEKVPGAQESSEHNPRSPLS